MNRKLQTNLALLLAVMLLVSLPSLSIAQQPGDDEEVTLPHRPLAQIYTSAYLPELTGSHLLNHQLLLPADYPIIGKLSGFGSLRLDDQHTIGSPLHQGSRIQVGQNSCAQADLGTRGKLTINANSELAIDAGEQLVYAKLINGSMKVELPAGISGVIEAANTLIINQNEGNSAFLVRIAGSEVQVDTQSGQVASNKNLDEDELQIAFLSRREEHMRPSHSLEVQVKVTDKQRRPRAGMVVNFDGRDFLGNASGSVNPPTAVTDANGIAHTSFTAGPGNGRATITATISGTAIMAAMSVSVQGGLIFGLNTMQVVIIGGVAAATGIGIQQGISNSNNNNNNGQPVLNQIDVIGSGNQ